MSKLTAKHLTMDSESLEDDGNGAVQAKLAPGESLEKSASGIGLSSTISQALTFSTVPTATSDPATANELTRKSYVDGLTNSSRWKMPVVAMVDANVASLSGVPDSAVTDGVTVIAGDRVLLTAQSTASQNGIWLIAAGAWTRPTDFTTGLSAGSSAVIVQQGGDYADQLWICTSDAGTDVVGTHSLAWVQLGADNALTPDEGLTITGGSFSVVAADTSIQVNENDIQVFLNEGQSGLEVSSGLRIAESAAGDGLDGGGANPLEVLPANASITVDETGIQVDPAELIRGGDAEIDGDQIDIDIVFDNITADTTPAQVDNAAHLGAILKGIDNAIGDLADTELVPVRVEKITLTSEQMTAKTIELSATVLDPDTVSLTIAGGALQVESVDYTAVAASNQITWNELGMDGLIQAGDVLIVIY